MNKIPVILLYIAMVLFSGCQRDKLKKPGAQEVIETEKAMVGVNRILVKKDAEKIKAYVQRRGWKMEQTQTGLWYKIYEPGTGEKIHKGLPVSITYNISLIDGTNCYSSDSLGVKTFMVGQGGVESGLEEGILLLRVGDRARFIIPPYLAYGLQGDGNRIPAHSIIIYDLKVIKFGDK